MRARAGRQANKADRPRSCRAWLILAALLLALVSPAWAADALGGRDGAGSARFESAGPSLAASLWRLSLACLVVAGLLYGGSRLIRRLPIARFLRGGDGPIRIEGRTVLGSGEYLCLVRVGARTILIGVSAGRIVPLHAWPEADAPVARVPGGGARVESVGAWVGRGETNLPERDTQLPAQLRSLQTRLGGRPT